MSETSARYFPYHELIEATDQTNNSACYETSDSVKVRCQDNVLHMEEQSNSLILFLEGKHLKLIMIPNPGVKIQSLTK